MQITKEIYLDFYNINYVSVTAKQYDTGRGVSIQIIQNGSVFQIPAGAVAKIASEDVWNNCTLDGNKIIAPLSSKLLEKPGTRKCQIELTDGTDKLTTVSFELIVLASERDDMAIEGGNELNTIDDIIRRGEESIDQINTVTDEVQRKLDNGEFVGPVGPIGPVGPQGPKGAEGAAVITKLDPGLFAMSVNSDGHLIMTHNDNEPKPPFEIRDGRLVYITNIISEEEGVQ